MRALEKGPRTKYAREGICLYLSLFRSRSVTLTFAVHLPFMAVHRTSGCIKALLHGGGVAFPFICFFCMVSKRNCGYGGEEEGRECVDSYDWEVNYILLN